LGSENWTLGPEALVTYKPSWGILGALAGHQWDYAGSGGQTNRTNAQVFYFLSLGGGWQVGGSPTISYNWAAADSDDRWTVPLGLGVFKTTKVGDLPLKIGVEARYSVVTPDTLGSDWQIYFSVTPIIPNPFGNLFK